MASVEGSRRFIPGQSASRHARRPCGGPGRPIMSEERTDPRSAGDPAANAAAVRSRPSAPSSTATSYRGQPPWVRPPRPAAGAAGTSARSSRSPRSVSDSRVPPVLQRAEPYREAWTPPSPALRHSLQRPTGPRAYKKPRCRPGLEAPGSDHGRNERKARTRSRVWCALIRTLSAPWQASCPRAPCIAGFAEEHLGQGTRASHSWSREHPERTVNGPRTISEVQVHELIHLRYATNVNTSSWRRAAVSSDRAVQCAEADRDRS